MNGLEREVRAALRWHSARWRRGNEDYVTGIFLAHADDEGWQKLPETERRAAMRRGVQERIRWVVPGVLGSALIAVFVAWTVVSVVAGSGMLPTILWAWVSPVLLILAVASVVSAATNAVTIRGVVATGIGIVGSLLLSASWAVGWARDDAITAGQHIPIHYFWFTAAAYVLVFCSAVAVALGGLLEAAGMPAFLSVVCALLGAVMASAVFAFVALVPFATVPAGVAVSVTSLISHLRAGRPRRRSSVSAA